MSVNSKMKAIADNIRAITGETQPLSLDDMAIKIASLSSGGEITAGTFTALNVTAQDGLIADVDIGFKPAYIIAYIPSTSINSGTYKVICIEYDDSSKEKSGVYISSSSSKITFVSSNSAFNVEVTENGFKITKNGTSTTILVKDGEWRYIAIK